MEENTERSLKISHCTSNHAPCHRAWFSTSNPKLTRLHTAFPGPSLYHILLTRPKYAINFNTFILTTHRIRRLHETFQLNTEWILRAWIPFVIFWILWEYFVLEYFIRLLMKSKIYSRWTPRHFIISSYTNVCEHMKEKYTKCILQDVRAL